MRRYLPRDAVGGGLFSIIGKRYSLSLEVGICLVLFSCKKEEEEKKYSEKFLLLTTPIWISDSLLANGVEAGGLEQPLNPFKGETKFNLDGTGTVGDFVGTWYFMENETQLVINSDSLPGAVTAFIKELTESSLKIESGLIANIADSLVLLNIRITFKTK